MGIRLVEPESGTNRATRVHAQGDTGRPDVEYLPAFLERLVRLHEERQTLADDIRDIFAEAKSNGLDKAALKACVRISMEDTDKRHKRHEAEEIVGIYLAALNLS